MATNDISKEITTQGGIQFNTQGKFCKGNIQAIPKLQTKTATSNGTITQDTGYCGLSSVTVNVASPTLSGSATADNVLSGKTFYNTSTTLQTGTMTNNGAISGEISTKTGSFSIPSGYTTGGSVAISSTEQSKLLPANIKTNTTILGVTGSLSPAKTEETLTLDLSMASGNQVITPTTAGEVIIQATITKPSTLLPENIVEGISIGGVVGTKATNIPIDVATATEMSALLVSTNVGKIYKFTGTTDTNYTNGGLYEVIA